MMAQSPAPPVMLTVAPLICTVVPSRLRVGADRFTALAAVTDTLLPSIWTVQPPTWRVSFPETVIRASPWTVVSALPSMAAVRSPLIRVSWLPWISTALSPSL